MKRIEDLPEGLQAIFQQTWYTFEPIDGQFPSEVDIAELFFVAGCEAVISEWTKFNTGNRYVGTLSFGSRLKDFKDIILRDAAFEEEEPRKYRYRVIIEEVEE